VYREYFNNVLTVAAADFAMIFLLYKKDAFR